MLRPGRLNPTALAAFGMGAVLVVIAVVAPIVWGASSAQINTSDAYRGPSPQAWLGTDGLGRDVLLRTLVATRLSLVLALLATGLAAIVGVPVGALTGAVGPRTRAMLGRAIHLGLALPGLLVALFVVAIVGPGAFGATLAMGLAFAPLFARVAQTLAAAVGDSDYVAAARVVGVRWTTLVWRYVLPNTAEPLILQAGLTAGLALLTLSALSFVGLGVQTPDYDWGRLLGDGLTAVYTTPLTALVPGFAITASGLAFSFMGETIARATNPVRRETLRSSVQSRPPANERDAPASEDRAAAARGTRDRPVLRVRGLRIRFPRAGADVEVVHGIGFDIWPGEIVGLVGESGSGKSVTALALSDLLPMPGRAEADRLEFDGHELGSLSDYERRRLLATDRSIVFQDPMAALNPVLRIGIQLTEKVEVHNHMPRDEAMALAERRLAQTHIAAPAERLRQYPHELSGGMRQRAMIAMGLMTDPRLIIADEPTTALDVTVQAQILKLLRELNERNRTAVLFISHDLAVVSELCHRVLVIYRGLIVEEMPAEALARPAHPYTRLLLAAVLDLDTDKDKALSAMRSTAQDIGAAVPMGCSFAARCPEVMERCRREAPGLMEHASEERRVACWARVADGTVVATAGR